MHRLLIAIIPPLVGACTDAGEGREQDAVSFACTDAGQGREQDAVFHARPIYTMIEGFKLMISATRNR